jgi:class 3 adenylate cyclase/tetratricopeptide (TPR) repeat protein
MSDHLLDTARDAVRRRSWDEAADAFTEAARQQSLTPADLEALGDAAWWAGRPDDSIEALEEAYSGYVAQGENLRAAAVATVLMELAHRRLAMSVAAGWRSKAERLIEGDPDAGIQARLTMFELLDAIFSGRGDEAITLADRTIELARKAGDINTETEAMVFKGRALVGRGEWQEGIRLIDEGAATALSGSVGMRSASNVYCCTIETCRSVGDFRRAGEWTEEADRWMHRNAVGGYPGVCHIRRAELKRLRGDWSEAEVEATRACETLERYRILDEVGLGEVQLGLIKLQMGDYDEAEAIFARAFEHGASPQPGLALLMVARGEIDAAAQSLDRSLNGESSWDLLTRMQLLPVQVQISLLRGDLEKARAGVTELERIAVEFGRPVFEASALSSRGELELAEGHPEAAVAAFEKSLRLWREIEFPYEAAQVRTHLGRAHLASGDIVSARMELNAARSTFEMLGAIPAVALVDESLASIDRKAMSSEHLTKTFMFTDIVDSTDLIGVIGDDAWRSLIVWHDRELRSQFAGHGGVVINHAGDGFFVVFDTAGAAIECAVAVQRRLIDHRKEHGFSPKVRIGIHTGTATVDDGEYRGKDVHLAARVSSAAQGEEIVISAAALEDAGQVRHPVSEGETSQLKGIATPVVLHTVEWR